VELDHSLLKSSGAGPVGLGDTPAFQEVR
jgi:hypothetical protein